MLFITITVFAPPMDTLATQSGSSAPVEVSWSPPSDGANNITGYIGSTTAMGRMYLCHLCLRCLSLPQLI